MNATYATIIGILIGIFIFGLKTGAGCGFANIKWKDVLIIAAVYLVISIIMGSLIEMVDQSYLDGIASLGMTLHVFIAMILIAAGIYTLKECSCDHDVSKKTFLAISMPCPVCLTALFMSCMILASSLGTSGLRIGLLVGIVFFVSVISSTFVFKKMKRPPEDLGTTMMFLGIFYLLGAMIVPAYIKAKKLDMPAIGGGEFEILPLLIFSLFIVGGFVLDKMRGQ